MTKEEQEKLDAYLKGIIRNMPEKPGSYQYLDETGTIIYIGKAKNLKRRVSSYFNKEQNKKTAKEYYGKACDFGCQEGCDEYRKLNERGY